MNHPSRGEKQTILESLMVMAYNVGREHGKDPTMTVEEGRRAVLEILRMVDPFDRGDLDRPWPGWETEEWPKKATHELLRMADRKKEP